MKTLYKYSIVLALLSSLFTFAQAAPTPPADNGGGRGGRGGGRGNWDPAAMREMMMGRFKEQLKASDEEWQVIEPRVSAVFDASRALRELSGGRGFGRRGGNNDQQVAEVKAVEEAIQGGDATAIKTALDALRKARAAKQAELDKAKASLKEVLTVAQEAQLVLNGMLD